MSGHRPATDWLDETTGNGSCGSGYCAADPGGRSHRGGPNCSGQASRSSWRPHAAVGYAFRVTTVLVVAPAPRTMTDPADLVLTNAEVHTLSPDGDEIHEGVAIRDGRIRRVDTAAEVTYLVGVETEVIDLDGRVVVPGFIDAHAHVENVGQSLVHADLGGAGSLEAALDRLRAGAREESEWILGFGYDESEWSEGRYLTRADLDEVSRERPVAAFRVDMHTASLNSVGLDRLREDMQDRDVRTANGDPTGVVVEDAVGHVRTAIAPDYHETRQLVTAARDRAHARGVTGVHEMVRDSLAPRVYRDLDREGELHWRVRINYWSDHLAAVEELGLATNHGSDLVRVGGIKSFSDGSIGARTARLSAPYEDAEGDGDACGQWVVDPADLGALVERVHDAGHQLAIHAIGDEAIEETLAAYERVCGGDSTADGHVGDSAARPADPRHRIEHVELADETQMERMAAIGVVASVQPNFLQWAQSDGLYDRRLGEPRRKASNRFRDLLSAGVDLAFGSDSMPLDPLYGVHHAVNAPVAGQRLTVTEALRAYTYGSAYAGFDEDDLGTVAVGKLADLVALDRSPWDQPEAIDSIGVDLTVVDGTIVYDGR